MDADVIVVGAGPTGLMLARELGPTGVSTVVLERRLEPNEVPKAGGLSGQILPLLHYRGLLERFRAASTAPEPAPKFPFGGLHVDFTGLDDPPMRAMPIPQPRLEQLLAESTAEVGVRLHRGHEVVGVHQDDAGVTLEVIGPDGPHQMTARFVVGCDGSRSRIRELAGIAFPGVTYPEVQRLAQVTRPESVTLLEGGDLDVQGVGRVPWGFTWTERGLFAVSPVGSDSLSVFTSEEEQNDYDDDVPMTVAELRDSVRRVLGTDLSFVGAGRLTRFTFHARQAETYRDGRVLLAGDAAHLFPAPGVGLNAGMIDAVNLAWKLAGAIAGWAPAGLLDTFDAERRLASERTMLHTRAQVALRRGHDPAAEALRDLFTELTGDEQPLRRLGALMAGTDIRYPMPGGAVHPLAGTFAPTVTIHTKQGLTSVADLVHTARPALVLLTHRPDLRHVAEGWADRVDVHGVTTDHRPADALLIRADAHIAWAAGLGEPHETAAPALREALVSWFGAEHGARPAVERLC